MVNLIFLKKKNINKSLIFFNEFFEEEEEGLRILKNYKNLFTYKRRTKMLLRFNIKIRRLLMNFLVINLLFFLKQLIFLKIQLILS